MSKNREKECCIFIFRRDLRIYDNRGFIHAINNYDLIIPVFIFTPEQIDSKKNKYHSNNSVKFMIESLTDLSNDLKKKYGCKLHYFYGDNIDVLTRIICELRELRENKKNIGCCIKKCSVVFNMDYTPYARKRDNDIHNICDKLSDDNKMIVICEMIEDYILSNKIGDFNKPTTLCKDPYTVFTPFRNNALKVIASNNGDYIKDWCGDDLYKNQRRTNVVLQKQ